MQANAVPLLSIFETKAQLEVPLFQRQYVWNMSDHWEPLWQDVERKMVDHLGGRSDGPVHFLGAMVLDQKQTPTTQIERRQIIDGQQRLTTFQIFISAFRDVSRELGSSDIAEECEMFLRNQGMLADRSKDHLKVWPTQLDREQFKCIVESGSLEAVEKTYPLIRRKYQRKPDPRPAMVEAYLYFSRQLTEFFSDPYDSSDLEQAFLAIRNGLQVVVIDLGDSDDAQVIFETLNARGAPLLPADLLRNYIFLRAARRGESQEELYEEYWKSFDSPYWRVPVKQGRLLRPRSDLFLQHYLASKQSFDIPVTHLFVEYRHWIEKSAPFESIEAEIAQLAKEREHFARILTPTRADPRFEFFTFIASFDVRTVYPLLLTIMESGTSDEDWLRIGQTLESYLIRRAICGLPTKNYNRVFLGLTRLLRRDGVTASNLSAALKEMKGDSTEWPSDYDFRHAWMNNHAYQRLSQPKIVQVLKRINAALNRASHEDITYNGELTVEHLMPQSWIQYWPLPDGEAGLSWMELYDAPADDPRRIATEKRNRAVQTLGNLTILTQSLNSGLSNRPWPVKQQGIRSGTLLPINVQLDQHDKWDEDSIEARGEALFEMSIKLWPK